MDNTKEAKIRSKLQEAILLLAEESEPKPGSKFGDIAEYSSGHRRIILYDEKGALSAFDANGYVQGEAEDYIPTSESIFSPGNPLKLDT